MEVRGAVESLEDVVGEEGRRREVCPAETVAQQEVGQDGGRQPGHRGRGSETQDLLLSSSLFHQVTGVNTLPGVRSQTITRTPLTILPH